MKIWNRKRRGLLLASPYLHSGAAGTLDDVLGNGTHRTAGRPIMRTS